ncbi:MAG: hypothetical protein QM757_23420 [Paludibaculum sp.]
MPSPRLRLWTYGAFLSLLLGVFPSTHAQPRILGRKVIAVVPLVGKGTPDDPRRPKFVPGPSEKAQGDALDYQFVVSDDGKWAVAVFSTSRPSAATLKLLDEIESSREDGVVSFDTGKSKKSDLEAEIKKKKADFDLDEFLTGSKGRGKN